MAVIKGVKATFFVDRKEGQHGEFVKITKSQGGPDKGRTRTEILMDLSDAEQVAEALKEVLQ